MIAAATKKAINKAMGRDYKKTCQKCQHVSPSIRRHKEHCRLHYLLFICPCGHHSHTKEVTRKHQLRAEKCKESNACTARALYTIDEASHKEWLSATGVTLPAYPRHRATTNTRKRKIRAATPPPAVEVRRVTRAIVGYKQPAMTLYNSQIKDKAVPSQLVVNESLAKSPTKKWRQIAMKSLTALRQLRANVQQQQSVLNKMKRLIDDAIAIYV